jgi:hypothetical protein
MPSEKRRARVAGLPLGYLLVRSGYAPRPRTDRVPALV